MSVSHSANAIQITAKLYDARGYVKRMTTREEYATRIEAYQGYIREGMVKWNLGPIESAMKLARLFEEHPIVQAAILAAYVEMIEPSK